MSKKSHDKKKLRERRIAEKKRIRRERLDQKRKLENHQKKTEEQDRKASTPDGFEENKVLVPGRNEKCPLHPQYKIKNCPHGCHEMFKLERMRQLDTTIGIPVDENDPRAGRIGMETDGAAGALNDLARVLGDL